MLDLIFFSCVCKPVATSSVTVCTRLFRENEDLNVTFHMLSNYPCHRKEKGENDASGCPGHSPPQNTASKAPLRQRLSMENFSPTGEHLRKL